MVLVVNDIRLNEFLVKICKCSVEEIDKIIQVDKDEYKEYKPKEIEGFGWYILKCKNRKWAEKISDSLYGWWICEDKTYFVLGCGLPNTGQLLIEEYDKGEDAVELLSTIYNQENSKGIIIDNNDICVKGVRIEASSDTDINFKRNKIRYYEDIVDSNSGEMDMIQIENLKRQLNVLNHLTYTPTNISLMPRTAGLNNIKQNWGNDRIDTFIYMLDLYYKGNRSIILDAGRRTRGIISYKARNQLALYLDSFSDIYDYCEKIYHIDKVLVDIMLQTGGMGLECAEMVDIYVSIANAFWNQKLIFYKNHPSKDVREKYLKMINTLRVAHGSKCKSEIPMVKDRFEIDNDLKIISYRVEKIKFKQINT